MQGDGGPDPADAVVGHAVALQEPTRMVCALHLEAAGGVEVLSVQADVVEHRSDVEQLGVVTEPSVTGLQADPPEDPAGVVVDQVAGGIAHQRGGFIGQLGVGDRDPGGGLFVGSHSVPLCRVEGGSAAPVGAAGADIKPRRPKEDRQWASSDAPSFCAEHPGLLLESVDDRVKQVGGGGVLGVDLVVNRTDGASCSAQAVGDQLDSL